MSVSKELQTKDLKIFLIVHSTVYNDTERVVHSVQLYSTQYTLYSKQCTHYTLYIIHYTV